MEQLVFLLIIGAISLIKWLMEKSAEQRANRELARRADQGDAASDEPSLRPEPATRLPHPDEAARKLREALGLPDDIEAPRPIVRPHPPRRTMPPPVPAERPTSIPSPAPVILYERPMPDLAQIEADLERRTVVFEEGPATPVVINRPKPPPSPAPARPAAISSLGELLGSREGLRKAVLAQEILGTPKGLVF